MSDFVETNYEEQTENDALQGSMDSPASAFQGTDLFNLNRQFVLSTII